MATDLAVLETFATPISNSIEDHGIYIYSITEPAPGYYFLVALCKTETQEHIKKVNMVKSDLEDWFGAQVGHSIKDSWLVRSQYQSGFGLTEFALLFKENGTSREVAIEQKIFGTHSMLPAGHRKRLFKLYRALQKLPQSTPQPPTLQLRSPDSRPAPVTPAIPAESQPTARKFKDGTIATRNPRTTSHG